MVFEETVQLEVPFDAALSRTKEAFAAEGFGTLTEIDVQATLRAKTGRDMARYVIVGACNPTLAMSALDVEPQIGVLLPCNVVVRESGERVVVEAMDPGVMAELVGGNEIRPIAAEARRLVGNAMERLSAPMYAGHV
jgi:uncharacterized protein (DUF302 family)